MQLTVRDWMIDLVVIVDPEATVSDALATMRRRYIHSVIVAKTANSDYGILTSTDISDKIVAQDKNPSQIKVKEIMNSPLITIAPEASLKECALTMKQHHIHHLPVMNADGQIVGMISATDFLVAAEAMGRAPGERIIQ
ncbi:MAG TPA: CBS domain-containing protein [Anaerolineaceae bacterium]|nr:CBS domain-containing protein [Anaerolineaceae bacterium]HPN51826.1 CBS domain-containing protein [Anaerolineaceae bacterium]